MLWHHRWLAAMTAMALSSTCTAGNPRLVQSGDPGHLSEAFRRAARAIEPSLVFVEVEASPVPNANGAVAGGDLAVGSGSGVVVADGGLILTNDHVVAEALTVSVRLADGRRLEAAVVGRDPSTDLALLRVPVDGLAPAILADSDSVTVGDWVLALGFPLGLNATVTAGIVSAVGRHPGFLDRRGTAPPLEHFIQTDAAINPGNSGGPVVDLQGRVVGISTALLSPTGYFAGYGFVVPMSVAARVMDDLRQYGETRRGDLGALLEDVTEADAEVYGLDVIAGAEVVAVQAGGPADRAGLMAEDVITSVEKDRASSAGDVLQLVARHRPGDVVALGITRRGRQQVLEVPLGWARVGAPPTPGAVHPGLVGLGFEVVDGPEGVTVGQVLRYSPAARAGLRAGQIVRAVFGQAVRTAADFAQLREHHGLRQVWSVLVTDPQAGRRRINFRPAALHVSQ